MWFHLHSILKSKTEGLEIKFCSCQVFQCDSVMTNNGKHKGDFGGNELLFCTLVVVGILVYTYFKLKKLYTKNK